MWTVYAIKIEGTLRYVGLTKNVGLREKQHNLYGYAGMSVSLTPLAVFETLAEADERETMLIQALSPPDNVSKSGIHRPGEWVIFPRMFNGVIIFSRVHVTKGMQSPLAAQRTWFSKRHKTPHEAVKNMPGWTAARALRHFGDRGGAIPPWLCKKACLMPRSRWMTNLRSTSDYPYPVTENIVWRAMKQWTGSGSSGRAPGPRNR